MTSWSSERQGAVRNPVAGDQTSAGQAFQVPPDINFPGMPLANNHGLHSPDHLVMEDGTSGPSHPRGSRHPTIVDKVGRDGHLINVAICWHSQVDSGRLTSHFLPIKLAVTLIRPLSAVFG